MKNLFQRVKTSPLFVDIDERDLSALLDCLAAEQSHFEKHSFIFTEGEAATRLGVVLSGSVHVVRDDFWGNRTIVARIEPGDLFGEAFSCAAVDRLPVSVVSCEKSEILLLDYGRVITTCASACAFHNVLVKNMTKILAAKNILLTQKMEYLTRRTTREKLLSFLSAQAKRKGGNSFEIPFDRQELADYLSVDRSALSGELSRMRDEEIIRFHKNHFEILT
ncbi:Crp/Fnr family transcriptional regulator [Synergistales bacterium]|nr:Crp/Fnr family transcriptional regulator [Synergistales bacterium]